MNVRLTKEQKIHVLNSLDIYHIIQRVLMRENKIRRSQEHFWVVGLDNKNKILFVELIGLGTVNRVNANPPDIFRLAIYKLAVNVILVHNHPSGDIKPSQQDIDFTAKMLKVGKLININVIDHLIVSEENYASFLDLGILKTLDESSAYEIIHSDQMVLEEWKIKMDHENLVKKELAQKMISKGYELDVIKELTGLTKTELKKLLP